MNAVKIVLGILFFSSYLYPSQGLFNIGELVWHDTEKNLRIIKPHSIDDGVFKHLQLYYECEFAPITQSKMNIHGEFDQEEIRSHWHKKWDAFILCVGRHPAGFCVVNHGSMLGEKTDIETHDIAEFFIVPFFRKKGYGQLFAHKIFKMYPGRWEVRQFFALEKTSTTFWRKVIDHISDGQYVEMINHPGWEGFVQRFTVSI